MKQRYLTFQLATRIDVRASVLRHGEKCGQGCSLSNRQHNGDAELQRELTTA